MKTQFLTALALTSTVAFGAALADNPFAATSLKNGYQLAQQTPVSADKAKEASCGADKKKDGKCGADGKKADGTCGADKKKDGKCGEGKCGADGKKADGACGSLA